ncbi:MAG TPA: peptidoglycan editing factor PgeF [Ramlibacter sp.]|nr:peptidoglycan editing factor PgeF [Ramlibacter sp.]
MAPWLEQPAWPAPAGVRAVLSLRGGGVSRPPYDLLNLGDHVGDRPQDVAANRAAFAAALDARPVFLQQVHGSQVVCLDAATPDGTQADGCVSTALGVACTIMVADCLPVLLTTADGAAVAAAHAGWRGLAGVAGQGIVEAAWGRFWPLAGEHENEVAARTLAWLGPCIGPQAFEVGGEVRAAFEAADARAAACFAPAGAPGKWLADLQGLARLRLRALGIEAIHGNDGSTGWCTVSNPSRFFSHRRDGISGRFAASIWLA